ncbi:MAG: DUF2209 family protein [Methanothrix sp.]|nr:DUF2209 family protein [Methanothrix sp.]
MEIVAIDVSGRHAVRGSYQMVCAAVSLQASPNFIERIYSVRIVPRLADSLDLSTVADLICSACMNLPGTIVAEPGDLYNLEVWRIKGILGREFKYPETLAERTAIELAHHISVAGRRLILDEGDFIDEG